MLLPLVVILVSVGVLAGGWFWYRRSREAEAEIAPELLESDSGGRRNRSIAGGLVAQMPEDPVETAYTTRISLAALTPDVPVSQDASTMAYAGGEADWSDEEESGGEGEALAEDYATLEYKAEPRGFVPQSEPDPEFEPETEDEPEVEAQDYGTQIYAAHEPDAPYHEPALTSPVPGSMLAVEEQVSVILRRQVPVRFGEAPRSWLGGLPRMPQDVAWPVGACNEHPEHGEAPLHFVAQIACADLPADLWGGLGPRHGWLLFFMNAQEFDVGDNPRALRVLHIDELGPERAPPAGMYPVRDEQFTGYQYGFCRSADEVPTVWRRWPIDLIPVPNMVLPDDFATHLYDEEPIGKQPVRARTSTGVPGLAEWPFTWRGALYVIDSVARVLGKKRPPAGPRDADLAAIASPEWMETALAEIDAARAELEGKLAETKNGGAWHREQLDRLAEAREWIAPRGFPLMSEEIIARLRASAEAHERWLATRGAVLDELRAVILDQPLDSEIPSEAFGLLLDALKGERSERWNLVELPLREQRVPMPFRTSLADLAQAGYDAALSEVAADLYVQSPEHRALIPEDLVARYEPDWRALDNNRPHRMGGMQDPIQSERVEGPVSRVLLLQFASDDAMQWCWGDSGAYYLWIETARLAENDFSVIDGWMECH